MCWGIGPETGGGLDEDTRTLGTAFVDRIEPVRRGFVIGARPGDHSPDTHAAGPTPARAPLDSLDYGLSHGQLDQMNLLPVHDLGYTGAGIVIGVLDTDFHRGHEASNQPGHVIDVVLEHNFLDDDGFTGIEPGDPSAQHNHGTMILATIASYLPGVRSRPHSRPRWWPT